MSGWSSTRSPDRDGDGNGEAIALVTTITEMTAAAAPLLAEAYHQRWEHETGNAQLKTSLRGPEKVLRSQSPDMVRQEIYGYLLTHYTLSALICRTATEAGIDPDRVKSSGPSASSTAGPPTRRLPPEHQERILATVMADITRTKHNNPERRHRTYPRVIKRVRHNSYCVKRPGDTQPGYIVVEESSPVLRGRLRESEQLHRHHGLPLPLEIRHDEFTTDIPETRSCAPRVSGCSSSPALMQGRSECCGVYCGTSAR
jgi:hypothetical protein